MPAATEPSLNIARSNFAGAVLGNNIYVFGGTNSRSSLGSTEVLVTGLAVTIKVAFDIKPGSSRNPLNVKSKGVLFDETPIKGGDNVLIIGNFKPLNPVDINQAGVVNLVDYAIFSKNWLQSGIIKH